MKTLIIVLVFSIFSFPLLQAQSKIDVLSQIPPTKVKKYDIDSLTYNQVLIKMDYASAAIENSDEMKLFFIGKVATKVTLVYTDFARSNTFNQPTLNKDRFKNLFELNNTAFSDTATQWQVMAQTGAKSFEKGKKMFHGFVVTFKSSSGTYLDDLMTNNDLPDSTVLDVFERNKDWKNMLIVADLTGSMTPYTAQILVWLRLNMTKKRAQHFTFFNDGDSKRTFQKEIGSTGGIYHADASKFEEVLGLAKTTMENGYGGDFPENDIEAILEGLDSCANCGDIVIIADNSSRMRDYELIEKVGKPVKVIICGFEGIVNVEYMDLARRTKGSVHTIEEDITNLMEIKEGEVVKIGEYQYIIKNGDFKVLGKL